MSARRPLSLLSLLFAPIAYASASSVIIPDVEPTPLLLDGRIDAAEWRGAVQVDVTADLRLLIKQSQGHVYLAVDTPGRASQPMDLSVFPADLRVYQLHASMQLAERQPTRKEPEPAWRWGNHRDWLASEMKRDPERQQETLFIDQLHPADGTEYQIARQRFPGAAWRVRLTIDAVPGSDTAVVYPADSQADDPSTWALWQFDAPSTSPRTLQIPTADGLTIAADEYPIDDPNAPLILLCHRAGWSRGEYVPIAAWFNAQGLHAIAIDQRSGWEVNGVPNRLSAAAHERGLSTDYLDAKADIEAALSYLTERYPGRRLLLMGSSYSSALALRIAGEKRFPLHAVMAFAPGEYFGRDNYVAEVAGAIDVPVLITSAHDEQSSWQPIAAHIAPKLMHSFVPSTTGMHGAQALWDSTPEHSQYRQAVQAFLRELN